MHDLFTADLEVGVDAAGVLQEGSIMYSTNCVGRQHLRLPAAGGVCREEGAVPLESSRQQVLNNGLLQAPTPCSLCGGSESITVSQGGRFAPPSQPIDCSFTWMQCGCEHSNDERTFNEELAAGFSLYSATRPLSSASCL